MKAPSKKMLSMQVYSNGKLDTLIDPVPRRLVLRKIYEVSRQAQVLAQDDAVVTTLANYGAVFAMNPKITGLDTALPFMTLSFLIP